MKKKLFIFSNEQVFSQDEKFYCDNIDLKSSPEGLNKRFEVNLFARKSYNKRSHEIKIKKKTPKEFEVLSGPYKSINSLKNDYIDLKIFGFEELDIIINE
mgnify:CR=1 FL=1